MELDIASVPKRIVAFFIDFVSTSMVIFFLSLPLGFAHVFSNYSNHLSNLGAKNTYYKWICGEVIFAFLIYVLSCIMMESSSSQATIGKKIMSVKVVDLGGRKLYLGEAVKRNLFKIISFIPFCLGCIWVLVSGKKQTWHDLFANTMVVNENRIATSNEYLNEDDSYEHRSYEIKEKILELRIASMSKRVVAFLIDLTLIGIVTSLIAIPFGYGRVISDFFSFINYYNILGNSYYGLTIYDYYDLDVVLQWNQGIEIVIYLLYILYCILMESSYQQATFGKQIMKLKVVDLEGRKLYFRESVKRNLFKIISLLPWYLGCIWAFFTDRKQAWHDMFAKTLVVNVSTNMVKVSFFEKDDSFEDNDPFAADLNEADSYEPMNENNNDQESKGYTLNDYEHTVCGESCEKTAIQPWIVVLTIIVIVVYILFLAYKESL